MRLFTALWPSPEAVAALRADVAASGLGDDPAWRPGPAVRWHVTLAFHGEDEPGRRARELQERAAGARAPRLRTAGTGEFPGVLWAGVETAGPADAEALTSLVALAGGAPEGFVAHLTLARAARRRGGPGHTRPGGTGPGGTGPFGTGSGSTAPGGTGPGHVGTADGGVAGPVAALPPGPWWTPSEVLLVASLGTRSGLVYEPVHRVALDTSGAPG